MDGENKNAVDSAENQNAESSENNLNVDSGADEKGADQNGSEQPTEDIQPVGSSEAGASSESAVTDESGDGGLSDDVNAGSDGEEASSEESASEDLDDEELDQEWDGNAWDEDEADENASPLEEFVDEPVQAEDDSEMKWYILKVQVNREGSICDALQRRVKMAGMDSMFGEILVPTEDVREFTKSGRQRIVKRKLYPGYIVVRMVINDDSWFLVRETSGIGDFTGAVGKPAPLEESEVERIVASAKVSEEIDGGEESIKVQFPYKTGDRVRVKEGYFQNHEGEVSAIDERNGRITVMINIFGRPNPVELDHWHVEFV